MVVLLFKDTDFIAIADFFWSARAPEIEETLQKKEVKKEEAKITTTTEVSKKEVQESSKDMGKKEEVQIETKKPKDPWFTLEVLGLGYGEKAHKLLQFSKSLSWATIKNTHYYVSGNGRDWTSYKDDAWQPLTSHKLSEANDYTTLKEVIDTFPVSNRMYIKVIVSQNGTQRMYLQEL